MKILQLDTFGTGMLCEVVDRADGSMARTPQLLAFAREHGLRCVTIADLLVYRRQQAGEAERRQDGSGADARRGAGLATPGAVLAA